jgi:hypothetical protein
MPLITYDEIRFTTLRSFASCIIYIYLIVVVCCVAKTCYIYVWILDKFV